MHVFCLFFLGLVGIQGVSIALSSPPIINIHPANTTTTEGQNVTLNCNATGDSPPTVTWYKDNQLLDITGRFTQDNSNGLTITGVSRIDEGYFYCNATINVTSTASNTAYVTVNYSPRLLGSPSPKTMIEKDTATFSCHFEGKPLPIIEWYRNDTKLTIDAARMTVNTSEDVNNVTSTLTITKLERNDEGKYKCVASNKVASNISSVDAQLTVNYPPNISAAPAPITTEESKTVTFTCEIVSKPLANVTWLKDNTPLTPDGSRLSATHPWSYGRSLATLTITNVSRSDKGSYSCYASNGIANSRTSSAANLTVHYPPKVLDSPSSVTKKETETVTLSCTWEGKPKPVVVWYRNDTKLTIDTSRMSVNESGDVSNFISKLTIQNIARKDQAKYKCVASNNVTSNVSSGEVQLTVIYPPKYFTNPISMVLNENASYSLTCNLEGKPFPAVKWLKNGQVFSKPSNVEIAGPTGNEANISFTLKFVKLKRGDQGNYSCIANNSAGKVESSVAVITVYYPSKVLESPKSQTIVENSNLTLSCFVEGQPIPSVTWYRNGEQIDSNAKFVISQPKMITNSSSTLKIIGVHRSDRGSYHCVAKNTLGNDESSKAFLTVHHNPVINTHPANTTPTEGQNVTLNCTATGSPAPNVTWYKDDQLLTITERFTQDRNGLTITGVSRNDEGSYYCNATNGVNSTASEAAYLTVNYPPNIFSQPSSSRGVIEKGIATFNCSLEGKPMPDVDWHRNDSKIVIDNSRITVNLTRDVNFTSILTINNVNRTDEGNYTCVANNIVQSDVSSSKAELTVHYPPRILTPPSGITTNETSNATFTCELESKPLASVTWLKDGAPVTPDGSRIKAEHPWSYRISAATLTIDNVGRSDEGNYTCHVSNGVGSNATSSEAKLVVNYPPKIFTSPKNITKNETESVNFTCSLEGKPLSVVTWWFGDTQIATTGNSPKYTVIGPPSVRQSEASLTINNLNRSEEGFYYCKADNSLDSAESQQAYLTVNYPPVIITHLKDITTNESSNVVFTCKLESKPLATVRWLKDGQPITNDSRIKTEHPWSYNISVATLTISKVNRSDQGRYTCHASNGIGNNVDSSSFLTVNYQPQIFSSPKNITKNETESVTFTCRMEGKPLSNVTWWHGDTRIATTGNSSKYTVIGPSSVEQTEASLTINNLNRSEEGFYTCKAQNYLKIIESGKAFLTVNYPPKYFSQPQSKTLTENASYSLTCTLEGKPFPAIKWLKNGQVFSEQSATGNETNISFTLKFEEIKRDDEGNYSCMASNSAGTKESSKAVVVVQYPPKIHDSSSSPVTKNERQKAKIYCRLEGKPMPDIDWYRNDTKLVIDRSRIKVNKTGDVTNFTSTLTIDNLNREDEADYKCIANNTVQSEVSSSDIKLIVNYPPRILTPPSGITTNETSNATFTCELESKPLANVTWLKDGAPVTPDGSRIKAEHPWSYRISVATLTIDNVNRSEEGSYTCQASNGIGNIDTSAPVDLIVNYPPKIFQSPQNITKNETESVTFTCSVEGKPLSNVTWWFGDTQIPTTVNPSKYTVLGPSSVRQSEASLTINNLNRSEEGLYYCKAKNSLNNVQSQQAYLTVNYKPKFLRPPATYVKKEKDNVTFSCEWEGKPLPTIEWYRNDTKLAKVDRMKVTPPVANNVTSTLTITNLQRTDEGKYKCVASNKVALKVMSPSANLTVDYPAENVEIVLKTGKNSVSFGKDFQLLCQGGGKPVLNFTWKRSGEVINDTEMISGDNQQLFTVNKAVLKDAGTYTCRGYNYVGGKESSNNIMIAVDKTRIINDTNITKTETTVTFPLFNDDYTEGGKKICFFYIFGYKGNQESAKETTKTQFDNAINKQRDSGNLYVVALVGINQFQHGFTVGDERHYPTEGFENGCKKRSRRNTKEEAERLSPTREYYYNKALKPNTEYSFLQRATTDTDGVYEDYVWIWAKTMTDPKKIDEPINVGAIVGGIIATLAIICLIILVLIFLYRRSNANHDNDEEVPMSAHSKSRLNSIARLKHSHAQYISGNVYRASEFENHVRLLHSNSDLLFSQEYGTVHSPESATSEHSAVPDQRSKNRYNNISAFDSSRVILSNIDGDPTSHYINANYLDGYNKKREYIAAQGPLPNTCDDFWRMIWERGSRLIVMVTNLEEKGRVKCHQYWPSEGSDVYGRIEVQLLSVVELSHYTIRSFQIKMRNLPEERLVTQYHYTAWPDHGVPSSVTSVLNFVRKASAANPPDAGPMVVHCSAGVGRTGTFIVIDAQLKRIAAQGDVDVYNYVMLLRTQRNLMVQVEEQYILIHDVLVEAIACGNTEIQARDLRSKIRELMNPNIQTGQTGMDRQFQLLSRNKAPPSKFMSANLPVNKNKNRYANVLPYDDTRVRLNAQLGTDGSDYINANYIDGYMQKRLFIATQAPIPDTIPDFWRMIWEQDCCTIVMLSNETQSGKVKVHRYWPGKAPTTIANLVIEMTNERAFEDYTLREFKVTNTGESASRTVRQYHYTAWPDLGPPDSSAGLTDLIGQVQKWQQRCGSQLITVHCSAGVGRTGVFCAVCSLIERLKAEALVDVFMTVKLLREQRPAMVQTKEQYAFCYQALGEYLDSFDPYNNFD